MRKWSRCRCLDECGIPGRGEVGCAVAVHCCAGAEPTRVVSICWCQCPDIHMLLVTARGLHFFERYPGRALRRPGLWYSNTPLRTIVIRSLRVKLLIKPCVPHREINY